MKWSQEDLNYLKENYNKHTISFAELIQKLGRTKRAICHKSSRLGLHRGKPQIFKNNRRQYDINYYHKNKKIIQERKNTRAKELKKELMFSLGNKCFKCGFEGHPACFDFHHTENNKEGNLANILKEGRRKKASEEVKKCILLCARCHRLIHIRESGVVVS